jgi:SAM-dependent methyltransferase
MMRGFRQRSTQSELMDSEPVSFEEFHSCLRELETINHWTRAYRPTLAWLERLRRHSPADQPLRVLDVGSGGGDMLRQIWHWAQRRGLHVELTGVDLNAWSRRSAESVTPPAAPISFETGNVFDIEPSRPVDLIISSLFTHHLGDQELIRFLQWMDRRARLGWFINDLHRHPVPYYFIKHAVRLLPCGRLVRHDAPVSVRRGFTRQDWQRALGRAEISLTRVEIRWFFPFRYGVACRAP